MTTAHSPLRVLKAQADKIAATLKAAERGEKIDVRFAEKIEVARHEARFQAGIVMDDKIIMIEMPWETIRSISEVVLAKHILNLMREARDTVN